MLDLASGEAASVAQELARGGMLLRFRDRTLEMRYQAHSLSEARTYRRATVFGLIALVDLFFLPELWQAPEIVRLSIILRFAILTPAALLFVLLDWRGHLRRTYGFAVTALSVLPTVLVAVEIMRTTSPGALPNLQAAPLIQLGVLATRLTPGQAVIVMAGSCASYIWAIAHSPVVPPLFVPSMALSSLAIGLGVVVVAARLDFRERQVFLLSLQAEGRNRALAHLVRTDALTGVANRRSFDEAVAHIWAEAAAQQRPVGLIMIDVDHFKRYNDHYGHQGGDECLRQVATAARDCVRPDDLIARYGGEEFVVTIPDADLALTLSVAQRLLTAVRALRLPHAGIGAGSTVSISLGAASTIPGDIRSPAELIEIADKNLYEAKRKGRDRVVALA